MSPRFQSRKVKPTVHYRVPTVLGILLIGFAAVADLLQMLFKFLWFTIILSILAEALGWFLTGLCVMIFGIVFASLGVNFIGGRRAAMKMTRFALTFICEFIPFLNAVPSLTIWVWLTIRDSHKEDRERAEEKAKKEEVRNAKMMKVSLLRQRRMQALAARAWQNPPTNRGAVRRLMGKEQPDPASAHHYRPPEQRPAQPATNINNVSTLPYAEDRRIKSERERREEREKKEDVEENVT